MPGLFCPKYCCSRLSRPMKSWGCSMSTNQPSIQGYSETGSNICKANFCIWENKSADQAKLHARSGPLLT